MSLPLIKIKSMKDFEFLLPNYYTLSSLLIHLMFLQYKVGFLKVD